ncbi:MAG: flagellar biosynthesis protein FlhB [Gemmatimonadales bacterium]
MADGSDQEKTEQPTAKKRQETAAEGRIPRSAELGTAALFLVAALTINTIAPVVSSRLIELFVTSLRHTGDVSGSQGAAVAMLQGVSREMLMIIGLLASALALTAIAVGAVQGRGTLSLKPLSPQWERLNPIANAKRMMGVQPFAELTKSLFKMTIVGWAVWHALSQAWPDLQGLSGRDPMGLLEAMRRYSVKLLLSAGLAYLVLALADYLFQLWRFERNLRMSKDEVKQESKQQDGDPALRQRIRAVARSRIRRQMFKDVPKADVVIVNPTHVAVALQYDPLKAPAPIVLAMGERKIAERIKQLAFQHRIPVIENRPLARALLAASRVGMMIPADLYAAVAEVLAFVIRQRARRGPASSVTSKLA